MGFLTKRERKLKVDANNNDILCNYNIFCAISLPFFCNLRLRLVLFLKLDTGRHWTIKILYFSCQSNWIVLANS